MGRGEWESEYADFFNANALRLRRVAWGVCGDWDQAEDVVQTAFVRMYAKFARVRDGDPYAYARRTVINLCLSGRRLRGREVPTSELPDRAGVEDDGGSVDLMPALMSLPVQQRAVVTLRFLEDLSVRDVAELLGISEGTVKSHSSRALDALRTSMSADVTRETR